MRSNGISEATACEVADTARFGKAAQVRGQICSKHIDDSVLEQLNGGAYPGHRFSSRARRRFFKAEFYFDGLPMFQDSIVYV
jgi:hypothetical protein